MVQVIGQGRVKPLSKSQQFAQGLGQAVETGKEYLHQYQQKHQTEQENEAVKKNLGIDISYIREPETRRALIVESLKGSQNLNKSLEIERLKGNRPLNPLQESLKTLNEERTEFTKKQREKLQSDIEKSSNEKTEKSEKSEKERNAVKKLLKDTGKFENEEELEEAANVYDLPTAKMLHQQSTKIKPEPKAPPKSETTKTLEKELAKGYIAARNEIPKLESSFQNIARLRELGNELTGFGGYLKSAFNTKSAAEYNTLAASLLDPIIKIFNPVGAVPVTKLNWIRETFSPKANDLRSTQEGKLATLERMAAQGKQRAQQKMKLFEDYNGEPPESEVLKHDTDTSKILNDFVDQHQYTDKLKQEVPHGKVLMIDSNGKPLHIDPSQTMPDGMSAIEFATQHGARLIE
jgi:hypothetical protein